MPHSRAPFRLITSLVTLLTLSACTDLPLEPATVERSTGPNAARSPRVDPAVWTLDDEWARIAREEIAGFAGYYGTPDGDLVLMLADTSDESSKRAAFEVLFKATSPNGRKLRVGAVKKVEYNFDELHSAHDQLLYTPGAPNTISLVDIDEVRNRLVVSVWPASAIGEMRQWVSKLGLVPRMVVVDAKAPVRAADCSPSDNLIYNCQRPTTGGLRITNADGAQCSLTANALITEQVGYSSSYYGFLTAGHCASQPTTHVAEPFFQGGSYVGFKSIDPNNVYNPCSLSAIGCHFADAIAVAYTGDVAIDLGRIVGMMYPDQPGTTLAPQIIPQYFGDYISSVERRSEGLYVGATVFKVGGETGETHGTITSTAVDVRLSNGVGYLSQIAVDGISTATVADLGDSGAPVFERVGGAQLEGILMGVTESRQRFYFSPWHSVTQALVGVAGRYLPYGTLQVMP